MPRRSRLVAPFVLALLVACAKQAPPPPPADPPGPGPLRVAYPPESVDIQGPMPREVAMNTLDSHRPAFAACVPPGAVAASGGRVTVSLRLTVGPEGRVRKAVLHESDHHDRAIDRCLVQRAKAIQFPNGPSQVTSVVSTRVVVSNP